MRTEAIAVTIPKPAAMPVAAAKMHNMAAMNAIARDPGCRDNMMLDILSALAQILSIDQICLEQVVAAITANPPPEDFPPAFKNERDDSITLFRAVTEALPAFREELRKILNRQGAKLPEWL